MAGPREDLMRMGAIEPGPVLECRETHISWVFLTATEVWKVKKPVNLGFLDFRSIAARKAACDAEILLNSRLAPGAYLGVVPVRRARDGTLCIAGDGETDEKVDWAVHMKRLPDEHRGDLLLTRGELGGEVIDRIAARLARFHESADHGPDVARHGAPETIAASVRENFAETREVVGVYLPPEQALEIERWQTDFLRAHAGLFEARVRAGRVRDGHGDLRLEHLYLDERGALTILDCIEFADRFRCADVCADVAFLSMDLAWHGRVDLAERLLARYAREADDYDLYAVVDFYESYRAYVRAKVSTLLAGDRDAPEASRARAASEGRRYFMLALSGGRRSLVAPFVVAVGGVIASGKSTVAEWIAKETGAPIVDTDRTRKAMLGLRPTEHIAEAAWTGAYDPAFTDKVYAEVFRRAEAVVRSGRPVVLDASFRTVALRQAARELAQTLGVPFTLVECRSEPDTCRARLFARGAGASVSDGRLATFDPFVARFEPMTELAASEHVLVDTTRPSEANLEVLRASLPTWPAGLG
jgi:aminoglycoside phosphotransferase family enzyme/predicted kinase